MAGATIVLIMAAFRTVFKAGYLSWEPCAGSLNFNLTSILSTFGFLFVKRISIKKCLKVVLVFIIQF